MNILNIITGGMATGDFLGLVFFALIGAALSILWQTTQRDVSTPATPFHFSWKFLWCDNSKRILASVILIYIALRFTPELFGIEIKPWVAFCIGVANDQIAQIIKNAARSATGGNKTN